MVVRSVTNGYGQSVYSSPQRMSRLSPATLKTSTNGSITMSDPGDTAPLGTPVGSLSLREVLDDPALVAAHPVVRAGWSGLESPVRWVHTSEVLDIAQLLRGGELVLVAGVLLAGAGDEALRTYLDSLADVGACGLAIETARLGGLPAALVDAARARDFPLVELTEVVRFVDVTRAVNSRLVAESVRELHCNDEVSRTLTGVLAANGDLAAMTAALRDLTGCSITLRSVAGAVIARSEIAGARPPGYARIVPVDAAGVTVASLEVAPRPGVDLHMIAAACRRAPEPLALALLRWRPLTRSDQHLREVFRLLLPTGRAGRTAARRTEDARALRIATAELGLDGPGFFVGVVATATRGTVPTAELSEALRMDDVPVLSELRDAMHLSVLRFHRRRDRADCVDDLVARLRATALPSVLRVGITDPADDLPALALGLPAAVTAARLADDRQYVRLAREVAVHHFVAQLDPTIVDGFLESVLGPLLSTDRSDHLLLTLAAVHRTGSRVAAATALAIHRQTLYQRLERIESLLGRPIDGTPEARGALLVATELALAQRSHRVDDLRGDPPSGVASIT